MGILLHISLLLECIAGIAAILCFKRLNFTFRLVAIQAICAFPVELSGYFMSKMKLNNAPLYNYYLILDFCLLYCAGLSLIRQKFRLPLAVSGIALFVIAWIQHTVIWGLQLFANSCVIVESMLLLPLYLFGMYREAVNNPKQIYRIAEMWLISGLVLFYGANLPYLATQHYLSLTLPLTQMNIICEILLSIVILRYLFTTIAFFLYYRSKAASSNFHEE